MSVDPNVDISVSEADKNSESVHGAEGPEVIGRLPWLRIVQFHFTCLGTEKNVQNLLFLYLFFYYFAESK